MACFFFFVPTISGEGASENVFSPKNGIPLSFLILLRSRVQHLEGPEKIHENRRRSIHGMLFQDQRFHALQSVPRQNILSNGLSVRDFCEPVVLRLGSFTKNGLNDTGGGGFLAITPKIVAERGHSYFCMIFVVYIIYR